METKVLIINPFYDSALVSRNTNLVMMVIEKKTSKVIKCAVIERQALPKWIVEMSTLCDPEDHIYLISTMSIQGELLGIGSAEKIIDPNQKGMSIQ